MRAARREWCCTRGWILQYMSDLIPKVFLKLLVGVERELNFGEHRLASRSMIDNMHDCTVHRYAGRISHMLSPVGVINRLRTISPSSSQAYDRLGSHWFQGGHKSFTSRTSGGSSPPYRRGSAARRPRPTPN